MSSYTHRVAVCSGNHRYAYRRSLRWLALLAMILVVRQGTAGVISATIHPPGFEARSRLLGGEPVRHASVRWSLDDMFPSSDMVTAERFAAHATRFEFHRREPKPFNASFDVPIAGHEILENSWRTMAPRPMSPLVKKFHYWLDSWEQWRQIPSSAHAVPYPTLLADPEGQMTVLDSLAAQSSDRPSVNERLARAAELWPRPVHEPFVFVAALMIFEVGAESLNAPTLTLAPPPPAKPAAGVAQLYLDHAKRRVSDATFRKVAALLKAEPDRSDD